MPPSKTGRLSLKVVIFPSVMCLVLDDGKLTNPDIINQIHDLFLQDHRILAQSISEQLKFSRERVGSIIDKDLDMRKLTAKCVPKCL